MFTTLTFFEEGKCPQLPKMSLAKQWVNMKTEEMLIITGVKLL